MACLNLHECILRIFIAANANPELFGWAWPSLMDFLAMLQSAIEGHPTKKGLTYGEAQEKNGLRVAAVIIDDVDDSLVRQVRALDLARRTVFGRWRGKAHPLRLLASLIPLPEVLVPDFRMDICRTKISTPNRNWVHGPYLAVLLYEITTGLVVRGRFWPVWVDVALDRFAIARSRPETIGIGAANDAGGVVIGPTIRSQLTKLQEAYGHLWNGDINLYLRLCDWMPMPVVGRKPTILEEFALRALEHYATDMRKKLRFGKEGQDAGHFHFQHHVCKRGTASAIETDICQWVADLYADPSNDLFKSKP